MGLRQLGILEDSLLEVLDSMVQFVLFLKCRSQTVVSFRGIRIQLYRSSQIVLRFFVFSNDAISCTQLAQTIRIIWIILYVRLHNRNTSFTLRLPRGLRTSIVA